MVLMVEPLESLGNFASQDLTFQHHLDEVARRKYAKMKLLAHHLKPKSRIKIIRYSSDRNNIPYEYETSTPLGELIAKLFP